jgi:hypothetical protein
MRHNDGFGEGRPNNTPTPLKSPLSKGDAIFIERAVETQHENLPGNYLTNALGFRSDQPCAGWIASWTKRLTHSLWRMRSFLSMPLSWLQT